MTIVGETGKVSHLTDAMKETLGMTEEEKTNAYAVRGIKETKHHLPVNLK